MDCLGRGRFRVWKLNLLLSPRTRVEVAVGQGIGRRLRVEEGVGTGMEK